MALLRLENVHSNIGQFQILQGVDLDVQQGEVHVLLGRNGAGKTTTLRTIMGYVPVHQGAILFRGEPSTRLTTWQIHRAGIGYVPEDANIFPNLTIAENLLLADPNRDRHHADRCEQVFSLFPDLRDASRRMAGTLSGGQKQMLAMASVLVAQPPVILIDEPSKGLSPAFVDRLAEVIASLKQTTTVLLVEQNFYLAHRVADRFTILDDGRTALSGNMADLAANEEWQHQYLALGTALERGR